VVQKEPDVCRFKVSKAKAIGLQAISDGTCAKSSSILVVTSHGSLAVKNAEYIKCSVCTSDIKHFMTIVFSRPYALKQAGLPVEFDILTAVTCTPDQEFFDSYDLHPLHDRIPIPSTIKAGDLTVGKEVRSIRGNYVVHSVQEFSSDHNPKRSNVKFYRIINRLYKRAAGVILSNGLAVKLS
jgi:hypothetical protein